MDNTIAGVFSITDEGALIWAGRDKDSLLHKHQIATNPLNDGKYLRSNKNSNTD